MALIECSECRNSISDKATACPRCGCPLSPLSNGTSVYEYPSSSHDASSNNASNVSSSGGCSTVLGGIAMIAVGGLICFIAVKVLNFIIALFGGVLALIGFCLMSFAS